MKLLFNLIINASEKETGYSADYMRDMLRASGWGFFKFLLSMPAIRHRKHAPDAMHLIAQLGATQQEACGPCLEISKKYARQKGISDIIIDQLIAHSEQVEPLHRAAFLMGAYVAGGPPVSDTLVASLKKEVGEKGYTELVMAAAAVRVFPAIKRGLGYADMCALPEGGNADGAIDRPAM
jgi:hypothetical protein